MKNSIVKMGARVSFPAFTGERVYMREFVIAAGLPADLRHWQPTVDAMLAGLPASGIAYLMIDQAEVCKGDFHRRPGLHVDNYWRPAIVDHGGPTPRPGHGGHVSRSERELIVIASTYPGCEALVGGWSGDTDGHGDCSHVNVDGLRVVPMLPGRAWVGETGSMLHRSVAATRDMQRTVVRLNVPLLGIAA